MEKYTNPTGRSGVIGFEIGRRHIDVQFIDGHVYRYARPQITKAEFDEMARRAKHRDGLSTYITRHIRGRYARKWRPRSR